MDKNIPQVQQKQNDVMIFLNFLFLYLFINKGLRQFGGETECLKIKLIKLIV